MARQIKMMNETQKVKSKKGKVIHTAEKTPAGSLRPVNASSTNEARTAQQDQTMNRRQAFRQMVSQSFGGTQPVTAAPRTTSQGPMAAQMPQDNPYLKAAVRQMLPAYQRPVDPITAGAANMLRNSARGNIDLYSRPQYRQPDGSISTVNSISIGDESGKEILIPTIGRDAQGRPVQWTDDQAIDHYRKTGENLGKFNSIEGADKYAEMLHRQQEAYYSPENSPLRLNNVVPRPYELGDAVQRFQQTGEMNISPELKKMMDEAPESRQGLRSSTQEEVDAAADWTAQRVANAEQQQRVREMRTFDRHNPVIAGALQGTGLPSMLTAGEQALARLTGNEEAQKQSAQIYADELREAQGLQARHPLAYNVGNVAGNIATVVGIGKVIGAIPAFANMSNLAQAVVSGAGAMGGTTAIQEAGAASTGMISPKDYALDIATGAGAGAAGGAVSSQIAGAGMNFLRNHGLTGNALAQTVVAGLSSSGYSGAGTAVRQGSAYLRDPENYQFDAEQAAKDAAVAFAFGAFSFAWRNRQNFTMNQEDPNQRPSTKYFDDCKTPGEIDSKLRQYARQYHPDQPNGNADLFAEISAEATAMKAWMNVNNGARAYQRAQEAYSSGDTAEYQAAQREYNAAVNALMVDVQSGAIQGNEAVEALQILQSVSANLAGPEAQAPATSGSEALAALADQGFPSTEAQLPSTAGALPTTAPSTGTGNVQVPQDAVATSQQEIPGNPYEMTAAQRIDNAAKQLQAAEYERSQQALAEQSAMDGQPAEGQGSLAEVNRGNAPAIEEQPVQTGDQKLAALAAQATENQAAQKRDQIQAIYEAGKTQNPDFQTVMDSATMLTEAEKTDAFYRGLTAAAAEAAGIGKEISYGGQQQEEGNYLSGEGSGRNLPLSAGERDGGVSSEAGGTAEGWQNWTAAADPDLRRGDGRTESANVTLERGVPAEKVIRTAAPGQVIYPVKDGGTPAMRKTQARITAYDPDITQTPFVSKGDILSDKGEYFRAFADPVKRQIGYRINDEQASSDKTGGIHEVLEMANIDGKIDLSEAEDLTRHVIPEILFKDIIKAYQNNGPEKIGIQHAIKEAIFDITAGINQFNGHERWNRVSEAIDFAHGILYDYFNDVLGGVFDAEYDETAAPAVNAKTAAGTSAEATAPSRIVGESPKVEITDKNVSVDSIVPTITEMPKNLPEYSSTLYREPAQKELFTLSKDGDITVKEKLNMSGRDFLIKQMKEKGYRDKKNTLAWLDKTADFMDKAGAVYKYIGMDDINNVRLVIDPRSGNIVLRALVKNGEYPVNIDLTKECTRRIALGQFVNWLAKNTGKNGGKTMLEEVPLTAKNLVTFNRILKDEGFDTACLGCFVETRRYHIQEWADSFVEKYNKAVEKYNPGAGYFDFADKDVYVSDLSKKELAELNEALESYKASLKQEGAAKKESAKAEKERLASIGASKKQIKDVKSALSNEEKINVLVRTNKLYQKKLRPADLITPGGRTTLHRDFPELESLVLGHYGSNTPKSVELFTPYNYDLGSILSVGKQTLQEYVAPIGGAREQSFSDSVPTHLMDQMEKTADMAVNKLPDHLYTKVPSEVLMFGLTQRKMNMSIMFNIDPDVDSAHAGLRADGSYFVGDRKTSELEAKAGRERTFVQSFPYDMARKIQHMPGYSKNCGMIGVGYSWFHINKMLNDPEFGYLIGYHPSGMNGELANASYINKATSYEPVQNTLKITGLRHVTGELDGLPSYASWPQGTKTVDNKMVEKTHFTMKDFDMKGNLKKYGGRKTMKMFLGWLEENRLSVDVSKASYKGEEQHGVGSFPLYDDLKRTRDYRKTADNYITWCLENDMLPEFFEFAGHDNYFKFIYDFTPYDHRTGKYSPQLPVKMIFPDNFFKLANHALNQWNNYMMRQEPKAIPTFEKMYDEAVRYSSKLSQESLVDSSGKTLTAQQAEYFKDSKARDAEGNLLTLYHGTGSSGFTKFRVKPERGVWLTTSKRDADSYAGNFEGKLFDPNEAKSKGQSVGGSVRIGKHLRFENKADMEQFLKENPDANEYLSDRELLDKRYALDDLDWDELDEAEDEYNRLKRINRSVGGAYERYEMTHSQNIPLSEMLDHPERYSLGDVKRAWYTYDRNADLDDEFDYSSDDEFKQVLIDGLKDVIEERAEENGPEWRDDMLNMQVSARIPEGMSGEIATRTNRTYALYANVVNPYVFDNEGRGSEGNGRFYHTIEKAMAYPQYDGVIVENARVGRYQDLGTVVLVKDANQVKLTSNQNPTENEDIRYSSKLNLGPKFTDYDENVEKAGMNVSYSLSDDGKRIAISPESYMNDATWKKVHNAINRLGYGMPSVEITKQYVLGGYNLQPDQTEALKKIFGISNGESAAETDIKAAKATASKAARQFGVTRDLKKAAYLTVNGTMLDFSEGQRTRTLDHRAISQILDLPEGHGYSDGMIEFMNQGNIRLQSYGIDISKEPNQAQRRVLRQIIEDLDGEFVLDISNEKGDTVASVEYSEGTRTAKILADIDRYFKEGTIPEQNSVSQFHMAYSSKLNLKKSQKQDEEYDAAVKNNDMETAARLVKEVAADAGYTEELYHGTGAFGFTKFDLGKMNDGASIFATSDRSVAESYSGETKRELISQRAGESDDAIIDRIDGTKDEDLLPLIRENLDSKYERVPQERLSEMRDERVNDIRFYADKIMDFMDDNPGMFDEAKSIAASRLASSMYKLSRAQSADDVGEYFTQYNEDAWELKFMDGDAFYEIFDGSSGIAVVNNAIRDLRSLLESDVMFTNGEKKPGSTLDVLTPGEARTRLIGKMSKGIYHLYGKKENMLEFDANGDNWNMIDTARISNKAFRIKSTSNKDKAWLSGLYMPYNDAQSLAARAARDANGEDDYLDVKDLRDPLGKISGWEFRSHKTGEMVMELESALPSRAMTRDIAKYAREVGYDGVIMRNLKDSGGATAYNHPSDVYIYFKPNAVKSADTVTYDDGGNAIPLSERFKSGEDDIRYSTKLNLQGKEIELTEREEELMDQLNTSYLYRIDEITQQKDAEIAELQEKMEKAVGEEKKKARDRLERLRRQKNERIAYLEKQWRENTNRRIADLKEKAKNKLGEQHDDMMRRLAKLQAQKDKKIEDILAEHRRQRQEARDKRNDHKLRVKFQKLAQRAVRDSKNKPGMAAQRVQELLKDIDLKALGMRDETKWELRRKYQEILEMKEKDENYAALFADRDMKKVERLFKTQINEMSVEDINDLITELSALAHYQENTDRLLKDSQGRSAAEVGRQIAKDLKELSPLEVTNPVKRLSAKYLRDNLSPERAFNRLSGYKHDNAMKTFYRTQVLDGLTKVKRFEQKADELKQEFINDEKNKYFLNNGSKQTIPVTDKYGRTAMISPAMRVSLYMASKNTDNLKHIATDGVTVPEPKTYAKGMIEDAYGRGTTLILDPTDVKAICNGMTDSEKEFATLLKIFFDTYAKDAINETSVDLDGILRATVENYFPITSDKNFLAKSMDSFQDPTLEGWNNLKSRQEGANNKILLEDARQVLQRHIRNTARYHGLAVPMRNWGKVYGYTSHRDEATGTRNSVQSAIKNAWDADTADYIERLIRDDINSGGRKAERGIADAMRSAYAGATLTLNPSVALKQTTSYLMAGSILDSGSLMYGLAHGFTKKDEAYMDSITPWGWARRQGESTIELGDLARKMDPITKNTPNWNQAMDVWTTNRLFLATEESVKKEFKASKNEALHDLKRGDKKYDDAVAERYNQVLWRTQPQYEAAFRPEYLRKTDVGSRTFGMFKTESMQMSGELIDSWGQWKADSMRTKDAKNIYDKHPGDQTKSEYETNDKYRKESAKQFYRTFTSWVASNMLFAIMGTALNIGLLHKGKPYRNDKGEIDWQTIAMKTGQNFIGSSLGGFFYASTAMDIGAYLYGKLSGDNPTWYDIEVPGISLMNDAVENMGNLTGVLTNEEANNAAKAQAIAKFALAVSKFTPVGFAENIVNLANSVVLYNQDVKEGTFGKWEAGKGLLKDTSPTKDQYANRAVDAARKGDMATAERALKKTKKANLEKAVGRPITENMYKKIMEDPNNLRNYLGVALEDMTPSIKNVPDHGYSSFTKLREDIGDPERTQNWHHIVEQEQMEEGLAGFKSTQVNNTNNIVSIPSGSKSPHSKISEYYGSVQDFTDGKTVREWLKDKSFEEQWEFGVKQLREYGDLVPTTNGWVFVPDKKKMETKIPMEEGKAKEKTDTQRSWESRIAEAREDGSLKDNEIRTIALDMIREGISAEEAEALYRDKKKKEVEKLDKWIEEKGTFEDYLKGRNAISEAAAIKDKNKEKQAEKKKKAVEDYLRQYHGSYANELWLWELAGYSESTFEYH